MMVCCGEALIDLLPEGQGDSTVFRPLPGGSPFNTAIALSRLGVPSAFLGRLSTDSLGEQLASTLARNGVGLGLLARGPEPTTLAFVTHAHGQPRYSFYTQGTADRLLAPHELPRLPEGAVLHWGLGAVVLDGAPVASTLEALFRRESSRRLLSFDPNIRPAMLADLPAYARRLTQALDVFHLVKVSAEDLACLFPGGEPDRIASDWLARGPRVVVVTRGKDGASVYRPGGTRLDVPATPLARLGDTVGAGDSFSAGLLAALHSRGVHGAAGLAALADEALVECAAFASRVAARTCERVGCDPPWHSELT